MPEDCCVYRLGIDPKVLLKIINSSSGRCWSSEVYCPVPGVMDNVPSSSDYKVISLYVITASFMYFDEMCVCIVVIHTSFSS